MCAAITSVAIAGSVAAYTIANAEKQKKNAKEEAEDAQKAIDAFQPQELTNPFADLQISTLAAEQQTDANLSNYATSVDALQRGGSRSVLGGMTRLNESNVMLQNMISADLDKQDKQRELLQAQGEERIRAVRESREINALQGLGNQLQTARQDEATAKANMVSGSLALVGSLQGLNGAFTNTTPQQRTVGANGLTTAENNILNTNGNIIGSNFNEKPVATVSSIFQDQPIYNSDNASLYGGYNPFIYNG